MNRLSGKALANPPDALLDRSENEYPANSSLSFAILSAAFILAVRASIYPSSLYLNLGNIDPTRVKSRAFNGVPVSNTADGG